MKLWRIEVSVRGTEVHFVRAETEEDALKKLSDDTLEISDLEKEDYWATEVEE